MFKKTLLFVILIFIFACDHSTKVEQEVAKIPIPMEVTRFDQKFAASQPQDLPGLKTNYPFLFPRQYPDSVWIAKLSDPLQLEIQEAVNKQFPDFQEHEDELYELFQHTKYYFPDFKVPAVFTLTSEVDYKNKAIYTGDFLFISLDTYLGTEHSFYTGIQEFLKKNFTKDQIVVDAAEEIAKNYVPVPDSRSFLSHMIYYGKIQYLKQRLLPAIEPSRAMGYTLEEYKFAENNEAQIWKYFVENELIFDTNNELHTRFLYPAPFSKFYLQLDAESPARLGQYIGLKIVKAYMEKNDISLQKMLRTSSEEIFNQSKFKPNK